MKRILFALAVVLAALPTAAFAQDSTPQTGGLFLRIGGDVRVPAGDAVDSVIVINGNATVAGLVHQILWVVNGDVTISGQVNGDVVVIGGTLHLAPGATVKNVSLVRSTLTREAGATITGSTSTYEHLPGVGWGLGAVLWGGVTLLVLAAGVLFAATGGRQLLEMDALLRQHPGETILSGVLVWIALPILAVLVAITVVGIPLTAGVFVFLLPALGFLGYLVTGTAFGLFLMRRTHSTSEGRHPYLATVIGLVLLQAVGLIPVIGWLVVLVAGLLGAGLLAYRLWRGWRDRAVARSNAAVPAA